MYRLRGRGNTIKTHFTYGNYRPAKTLRKRERGSKLIKLVEELCDKLSDRETEERCIVSLLSFKCFLLNGIKLRVLEFAISALILHPEIDRHPKGKSTRHRNQTDQAFVPRGKGWGTLGKEHV